MARRHGTGESLHSARKHLIIKEIQAAVGRELAARSEVPNTMPSGSRTCFASCIDDCAIQTRKRRRFDRDRAHQATKEA
jgi:hypothetical protein